MADLTKKQCSPLFCILEILIKNLPPLIFLVTAYINFKKVRRIGFIRVVHYDDSMTMKVSLMSILFLINLGGILISVLIHPLTRVKYIPDSFKAGKKDDIFGYENNFRICLSDQNKESSKFLD